MAPDLGSHRRQSARPCRGEIRLLAAQWQLHESRPAGASRFVRDDVTRGFSVLRPWLSNPALLGLIHYELPEQEWYPD